MSSSSSLRPIYIAGFVLVGVLLLGVALWLAIRRYRRWAQAKREGNLGAAFLSVKGLVRDGNVHTEKAPLPEFGSTFSREQLTRSVILPDKVLIPNRPAPVQETPQDILEFHRQSGNFPRPFSPKPFAFALTAAAPNPRGSIVQLNRSSMIRNSFMSTASTVSRFSVISSSSSVDSSPTTGTNRKVRQLFNPILPDELVTTLGERLTVVQSFDDGWCVVGRESTSNFNNAKSLFKSPSAQAEPNVELGVVPAWCFLKPVKGLRAERPVRSTSLGITVQMEGPAFSSREEIISWSNF
ncbi:uncharacterized protein BT62DRAFT_891058 [Guyanagaster necrorhizus]|uniref:SH3 domain-containing protein n=1 Tax=Guyanagaster necrorhizus TaxID=856835 RepID=A0A9P7VVJ2_9AGAR|nr:uncharacterized protein BT62DRAFT_891058 [Guyanagaster necrorhizus MCA 3950]KAG7448138.1 hypothetical protein BT62DRAFT_891058 [Guyanagaster necrorhizus MCA 3950]